MGRILNEIFFVSFFNWLLGDLGLNVLNFHHVVWILSWTGHLTQQFCLFYNSVCPFSSYCVAETSVK
jgi:hypothetical protein